ncbi:unnamed protein product [Schistosoma bovis]|nr:unnamed protein product [Schistosoma bovis]
MIQSNEHITIYFAVMIDNAGTNTFRVIQEQTTAMAFEWETMTYTNLGYVYLLQDIPNGFDRTVKVYEGNIGLLEAIGEPCEHSKYRAEGYNNDFWASELGTFHMTYKRGELFLISYLTITFPISVPSSSQLYNIQIPY